MHEISHAVVMAVLKQKKAAITDLDYARHRINQMSPADLRVICKRPDPKDFTKYQRWRRRCLKYNIIP